MQHTESSFTGHDGLDLYYQSWQPDAPPKAALIIVHGLGEHSGRYLNLVNPLAADGYAVYAFDNRGHGRSPGPRGHADEFAEFRRDVVLFQKLVEEQEGERPLFMMGHSLGGLIVLDYLLHENPALNGVVISAPGLDTGAISPLLMAAAKLLSRLAPTLSMNSGLDAAAISRDPAVVAAYQTDPLVHGKGTPRLATESTAAIAYCMENAGMLQLPILMIHGTGDRLTSPRKSREFFDKISSPDKTYIPYEGGYHESLNDIHHEQVAADIQEWLNGRVN
jgi:alpha-beta hydrolase superfamily lysophospholipase